MTFKHCKLKALEKMKHTYLLAAFAVCTMGLASCSDDDLSSQSIIVADKVDETPFDKWLKTNIVTPYNIEFKYRYSYNESDKNYYTVPANYEQAIKLVHIVKYSCIEAYNEVAGITFTRTYFPKLFYLEGEWHYRNNGTMELGTAEGGKKINLMGVNHLDSYITSVDQLNTYYLKTIHHEFTHILNQTRDYSASYQLITSSYLADQWSVSPNNSGYLTRGFISSYAQYSHAEDFAEMLSMYVTNTAAQWEAWMKEAAGTKANPTHGREYLEAKLTIVRQYMQNTFNIDIDQLREAVLRREADIVDGKVDLSDISIDE